MCNQRTGSGSLLVLRLLYASGKGSVNPCLHNTNFKHSQVAAQARLLPSPSSSVLWFVSATTGLTRWVEAGRSGRCSCNRADKACQVLEPSAAVIGVSGGSEQAD